MRKFILNKEKKELNPTDEQIARQKDFTRLHHDYERLVKRGKKPLYKDPKAFLFLFLIGIIVFLAFYDEITAFFNP